MDPFRLETPADAAAALAAHADGTAFLAGGTNLLDLMKLRVETPAALIDLGRLPYAKIELVEGNQLRLGALAKNSDVAYHTEVRRRFPLLTEAILSGASPQLRNMASIGGNLLQRTRCTYFNDVASPCNKRKPGSGCPALAGFHRNLAVLGTSEKCIATNPSDMNVALAAIDPILRLESKGGMRAIRFSELHRLPGTTPELETTLQPGELIASVDLPEMPYGGRSRYIKIRDRASFEFALVSVAVILDLGDLGGRRIRGARLALGGLGTKPWRALAAERVLTGADANDETFRVASEAALKDAKPLARNAFKIPMAKALIRRALAATAEMKA